MWTCPYVFNLSCCIKWVVWYFYFEEIEEAQHFAMQSWDSFLREFERSIIIFNAKKASISHYLIEYLNFKKCIHFFSMLERLLIFHGCYIKFCIAVQFCILIKFASYSIYVIQLLSIVFFITKTEKVFLSIYLFLFSRSMSIIKNIKLK